jgi:peptidoglycan/xylan/chitin deacetylase (PgdA/CDA1 family)
VQPASRSRSAIRATVAVTAGIAFLVCAGVRYEAIRGIDALLVALGLVVGASIAYVARGSRPLSVVGTVTAVISGWLLLQRDDVGTAVILAVFFGLGVGLAALPPSDRRGLPRIAATIALVGIVTFAAYVGAETPSVRWFGGGITNGSTHHDEVSLTFDDGPNLSATLPIMRILDAAGVKGTFFEVGKAIDAEPQITRALHAHGHLLGNHSYHHDQWRWLDPRYPELERTQLAFERAVGVCPAYYRPPHGDRTPFMAHVVSDHHMRMILWDDSSGDWAAKNPRTIARRILRGAHAGSIIVLHDGLDGNPTADRTVLVKALPLILEGLHAKHLDVVGLDKLIGGPTTVGC